MQTDPHIYVDADACPVKAETVKVGLFHRMKSRTSSARLIPADTQRGAMMNIFTATPTTAPHTPWNKGQLIGQKPPLKLREVWTVRTRLQMAGNTREIALFNLAIDSKLRGCDLVRLMVRDLAHGSQVLARATVVQQKTKQPVRFEVTDQTREAATAWIVKAKLADGDYLFPSRQRGSPHLSTRQYARIVKGWIALLGGDPQAYGTHSLRRTKATLIYRKTKNLRAVQLLLGHTKIEGTVRYCVE